MHATTVDLTAALGVDQAVAGIDWVTAIGASTGLLWRSAKIALAGAGELSVLAAGEAQEMLAGISNSPETIIELDPGMGPVAFGTFAFEPTADKTVIVPRVVLGATAEGAIWGTVIHESSEVPDVEAMIAGLVAEAGRARPTPTDPMRVSSVIAPEVWRDEIVTAGRDRIRSGELNKVVLAREIVVDGDAPIQIAPIIGRLATRFPNAIIFAIDGFIGASPELLVSRRGDVVQARPLAGTAPRSPDPDADAALAADLLASRKNRGEHKITIDWFLAELLPFCSYVDAEPEPSLLTIANVHHLQTLVEGVLSAPAAPILELVEALHPTPAVGGDPQSVALATIAALERADRGRYAGPTGWLDARGNGAFAVSVRSAQVDGASARLFTGVGVVADSDPQDELDETVVKSAAMLEAFNPPG